jgi:hypothetical protein
MHLGLSATPLYLVLLYLGSLGLIAILASRARTKRARAAAMAQRQAALREADLRRRIAKREREAHLDEVAFRSRRPRSAYPRYVDSAPTTARWTPSSPYEGTGLPYLDTTYSSSDDGY